MVVHTGILRAELKSFQLDILTSSSYPSILTVNNFPGLANILKF